MGLWLAACANQSMPTEAYIEQGGAQLLPETVDIGSEPTSAVTAFVLIKGARVAVAIRPSDCDDGVGTIRVIDEIGQRGVRQGQVSAFGRGDGPADQMFAAMCEIRHRKLLEKTHN
jgi:hypothetical protein